MDDDEWQPRSADAHLEGITRQVRKGEPGAAKPGGGARRFRGQPKGPAAFGLPPTVSSARTFTAAAQGGGGGNRAPKPAGQRAGQRGRARKRSPNG